MRALGAYRGLAGAIGAVAARQLLTELRGQSLAEAAAAITAVHVVLAGERDEALRAQAALRAIQAEAGAREPERSDDAMTITELAAALGVRTSTLRFWEQEGLVSPERVTSLRARRYGLPAIREARIVAALRNSGYGIPAVRATMDSLHGLGGIAEAERILQQRLDQIAARSVALLRAGADLAAVVDGSGVTSAPELPVLRYFGTSVLRYRILHETSGCRGVSLRATARTRPRRGVVRSAGPTRRGPWRR